MGAQPSHHVKLEHRVPLLTEMQQLSLDIDRKYGPSPTPATIPSTTTTCSYSPPSPTTTTHTHHTHHAHNCFSSAMTMMPPPSMLSAPLGPATGSPAGLLSSPPHEPPFGFCACCTAPLPPPTPLPGSRCEHRHNDMLRHRRSLSGLRLRARLRSMMLCGGGGGGECDEKKKQSRGLRLRSRKKGGRWEHDDDADNVSLADSFTTGSSSLRSVRSGKLVMMTVS